MTRTSVGDTTIGTNVTGTFCEVTHDGVQVTIFFGAAGDTSVAVKRDDEESVFLQVPRHPFHAVVCSLAHRVAYQLRYEGTLLGLFRNGRWFGAARTA